MKYKNKHGLIWSKVDRIQTQPDMRKTIFDNRADYYLKNAYRL